MIYLNYFFKLLIFYPKCHFFVFRSGFSSTSGQWEEAVHVYNSTPLQELSDLVGLALAYCKAGLISDSISGKDWKTPK